MCIYKKSTNTSLHTCEIDYYFTDKNNQVDAYKSCDLAGILVLKTVYGAKFTCNQNSF